ncbi:MAG: AraC family transcriptional regulator [Saprospiraceae bacterium]
MRCKLMVKEVLKTQGLHFIIVDLGEVDIMEDLTIQQTNDLNAALSAIGLELMEDKKAIMIEKIKTTVISMIHSNDGIPKISYSKYISDKLGFDYNYLSNIFTETKGITLQQFIILHKIEKAKELLLYEELNLTEISYKLDYSSVAHLSNQFKKITGLTPSQFKKIKSRSRTNIEEIGNFNTSNL